MKFSGAVALGFVSCALALPAGKYKLSPYSGAPSLGELPELSAPSELPTPSGTPSGLPSLPKGELSGLGQLLGAEKRGLLPTPSAAVPSSSSTPQPTGGPLSLLTGLLKDPLSDLDLKKRGLFPTPSAAVPSSSSTPQPTGGPLSLLTGLLGGLGGEKRGLLEAIPSELPTLPFGELPTPSGSSTPSSSIVPAPTGAILPFLA